MLCVYVYIIVHSTYILLYIYTSTLQTNLYIILIIYIYIVRRMSCHSSIIHVIFCKLSIGPSHENVFVLIAIIYYIIIICTCTRVYTRTRLFFSMRSTNTSRVIDAVCNVHIYYKYIAVRVRFFSLQIFTLKTMFIFIYLYPLRPSLDVCVYYIVLVAKYYRGRYFYIIIYSYHN